ncbi:hypothetical protein MAR_001602 [Mya arenaria]|uniref:Uncharacterized protein n=1 Tax=Mya arenaria TaxID=6604 RepID=A0ABY7FF37_MYAAR|nr:hypothetical protein MAR_001602 [Mya arenaria]
MKCKYSIHCLMSTENNATEGWILERNCRPEWPRLTCLTANVFGLCSTAVWFIVLLPQDSAVLPNYLYFLTHTGAHFARTLSDERNNANPEGEDILYSGLSPALEVILNMKLQSTSGQATTSAVIAMFG